MSTWAEYEKARDIYANAIATYWQTVDMPDAEPGEVASAEEYRNGARKALDAIVREIAEDAARWRHIDEHRYDEARGRRYWIGTSAERQPDDPPVMANQSLVEIVDICRALSPAPRTQEASNAE